MITLHDLEEIMLQTSHNKNYNTKRAAWVLYQYYIKGSRVSDMAAHLHISTNAVYAIRIDALRKMRAVWPLLSTYHMKKLYLSTIPIPKV